MTKKPKETQTHYLAIVWPAPTIATEYEDGHGVRMNAITFFVAVIVSGMCLE